ncbi:hypothetical protein [Vibrio quintilis]|uniref:DUF1240 domain-containing protein n=1 Tax=Vibrio quintilis TaxID=1117707 RepID=A0A1M7YPL1_9VIBR|nr:hypothetical protein [Vibrio quintilis]SHO54563.1 hypothetical protein VQ7734_00277 [Vibrio quintilis]
MVIDHKSHATINKNTKPKMSLARMIFCFLLFFPFSIYMFISSSEHIYSLIYAINHTSSALFFSSSEITLLGCGIILFVFSIRVLILRKNPFQLDKFFIITSIISFFIMFISPSIMESIVESFVKEHQYGYCAGASYKGLDCYTIDENTCLIETVRREKMLKDFWGE